ncbi:hypothetical protein EST38_g7797 [Candolleomyces aberdarensis]|uniref:Uncharacterized protein n=1 Tax=Candolleomyces aberdarensis TaxID=2316362 RepID=A0A4Q2DG91_9AGAR|nr:hypothetical protein EST38_g7797 [Candolleomyces aberdarensis]
MSLFEKLYKQLDRNSPVPIFRRTKDWKFVKERYRFIKNLQSSILLKARLKSPGKDEKGYTAKRVGCRAECKSLTA